MLIGLARELRSKISSFTVSLSHVSFAYIPGQAFGLPREYAGRWPCWARNLMVISTCGVGRFPTDYHCVVQQYHSGVPIDRTLHRCDSNREEQFHFKRDTILSKNHFWALKCWHGFVCFVYEAATVEGWLRCITERPLVHRLMSEYV